LPLPAAVHFLMAVLFPECFPGTIPSMQAGLWNLEIIQDYFKSWQFTRLLQGCFYNSLTQGLATGVFHTTPRQYRYTFPGRLPVDVRANPGTPLSERGLGSPLEPGGTGFSEKWLARRSKISHKTSNALI
jgi:hypothetical protein